MHFLFKLEQRPVDIFAAAGLAKPDISILSDGFLAEVKEMPQRNLAVELLRKLLAGEIRLRGRKNVVQARSLADMLDQALKRYQKRAIEAAQVIEELIALAKQLREAKREAKRSASATTSSLFTMRLKPMTAPSRSSVTTRCAPSPRSWSKQSAPTSPSIGPSARMSARSSASSSSASCAATATRPTSRRRPPRRFLSRQKCYQRNGPWREGWSTHWDARWGARTYVRPALPLCRRAAHP
jgi:hypothetical protein